MSRAAYHAAWCGFCVRPLMRPKNDKAPDGACAVGGIDLVAQGGRATSQQITGACAGTQGET
jgi:hypothetical protein